MKPSKTCDLCWQDQHYRPWFVFTICRHCNRPIIAKRNHIRVFTAEEKEILIELFSQQYELLWDMAEEPNHAHCHLEKKNEENTASSL